MIMELNERPGPWMGWRATEEKMFVRYFCDKLWKQWETRQKAKLAYNNENKMWREGFLWSNGHFFNHWTRKINKCLVRGNWSDYGVSMVSERRDTKSEDLTRSKHALFYHACFEEYSKVKLSIILPVPRKKSGVRVLKKSLRRQNCQL
jgi:hypothetical protein